MIKNRVSLMKDKSCRNCEWWQDSAPCQDKECFSPEWLHWKLKGTRPPEEQLLSPPPKDEMIEVEGVGLKIPISQLHTLGFIKKEDAVDYVEIDEVRLSDYFGGQGYSEKVDAIIRIVKECNPIQPKAEKG